MMNLTQAMLLEWRAVAESAAVEAGALIRRKLAEPRELTFKGFRDPVTDADVAAQQQITAMIQQRFPDHGFLAEEANSALPTNGPVRWIIDPVDGTGNYSRALPIFCVSIAVVVEDELVIGVIYDPMRGELFSAARGRGCTLNGHPIRVSATATLDDALVSLDWGRQYEVRQAMFVALERFVHGVRSVRAMGSSALALAWVAIGRIDIYVNFHLSPWDFAAGLLLIQEAGGSTSDLAGQPIPLTSHSSTIVANQQLHPAFLALLGQAADGETGS